MDGMSPWTVYMEHPDDDDGEDRDDGEDDGEDGFDGDMLTYKRRVRRNSTRARTTVGTTGSRGRSTGGTDTRADGRQRWRNITAMTKTARQAMAKKCGDACFALPSEKKYPVCPVGSCKRDPRGIDAAIRRARLEIAQYPNDNRHKKALARALKWAQEAGMTIGSRTRRASHKPTRRTSRRA